MALTARLTPQSKGEAPTISPWQGISSRNFRRNSSLWSCQSVEFAFSAFVREHQYIVLEWLCWHFHAFRDCLVRGRWCECQWRNWRYRFAKCTRNRTGCRGGNLRTSTRNQEPYLDRSRLQRMNRIRVQPLLIWSASYRSVQHVRVGVDAVDHSEGFSIDLDQCSCFMGKFVTPGAEQSFGEFDFLVAVRKSAIVSL